MCRSLETQGRNSDRKKAGKRDWKFSSSISPPVEIQALEVVDADLAKGLGLPPAWGPLRL